MAAVTATAAARRLLGARRCLSTARRCSATLLQAAEVGQFRADGAVCVRGLLRDWVDTVRAGIDRNMAEPGPHVEILRGPSGAGRYFGDYLNWLAA